MGTCSGKAAVGSQGDKYQLPADWKMTIAGNSVADMKKPCGVAVGGDGRMYVLDVRKRLLIFKADGSFVEVVEPMQLASARSEGDAESKEERGADTGAAQPARRPPRSAASRLNRPGGITVSPDGSILVITDADACRVIVMDAMTLAVQRVFGSPGKGDGEFDMPADAVVVEDELFVVDAGNNRIQVFELSSGRHRRSFGSRGVGPGGLNRPVAIAASPSGVLVADMFNSAIKFFALLGEPIEAPITKVKLKNVCALALGPPQKGADHGLVYVASYLGNSVLVYNPAGELVRELGAGEGKEDGQLSNVAGLATASVGVAGGPAAGETTLDGLVLVAERDNNRVSVFEDGMQWEDVSGDAASVEGDVPQEHVDALEAGATERRRSVTGVATAPDYGESGDAAATRIQGQYRVRMAKRVTGQKRRVNAAAVKIQASARGAMVRRNMGSQVSTARQRRHSARDRPETVGAAADPSLVGETAPERELRRREERGERPARRSTTKREARRSQQVRENLIPDL